MCSDPRSGPGRDCRLSVVVVVFDMAAEARNTLFSLSAAYQRGIDVGEYEVIVVDNGSSEPLADEIIDGFQGRITYRYLADAPPSPARALNLGAQLARGDCLGFLIDGARLVTPGLLGYALRAFRAFADPVVTAHAWHLGPAIHREAVAALGHSKDREIELLAGIDWKSHGYRLFEIATPAGSSRDGWFLPKEESSTLFMRAGTFEALGGYDERFAEPGGGLVNYDIYHRACELPQTELVVLLGEGSFHQMHGGAMTGADGASARERMRCWRRQYRELTGRDPESPRKPAHYLGHMPREALGMLAHSAARASESSLG